MARSTALVLSGLLVLAAAGCGGEPTRAAGGDEAAVPREGATMSAAELEEFAGIVVPDSAGELETWTASALDSIAYARVPVDGDDLDAFLAESRFPTPLEVEDAPLLTPPEELGWDLGGVQRAVGVEDRHDGVVRQLVVDLDDPDRPVIYLRAFTT